jgi:hypothetical protein
MPTDKESDCLTLNFYTMKNEQEMLELFQVEELEKRFETGWLRVSVGLDPEIHGNTKDFFGNPVQ